MLIEFSVSNFRSIKEKQTLSLVASNKDTSLPNNTIKLEKNNLSGSTLLKGCAIYGANASGKSNIFKAALFLKTFVLNSAAGLKPVEKIEVDSFKLDREYKDKPTEFEIHFIHKGVQYQYGLALGNSIVLEEWLFAFPHGSPQRWFHRNHDNNTNKDSYKFSTKYFKGEKEIIKEKTRGNSSFLSMAAQLNNEQLLEVYIWFKEFLQLIDLSSDEMSPAFTLSLVYNNPRLSSFINDVVSKIDLGIKGIRVLEKPFSEIKFPENVPLELRERFLEDFKNETFLIGKFIHDDAEGRSIEFDMDQESFGTRKFLSLIGPIIDTLFNGYTLFIDEIASNMHPLLVRSLVESFSSEFNRKNAQLIFTTHDTNLLDISLLRRDQIWFTEKNNEGATNLYPLTDFQPRNKEALQKGYLAGRYGAIPFITIDTGSINNE
ncbi:MAG: AAA family ATPase [bacterium]|jgi:AAA15 family ATPase/GTPase